MPEVYRDTTDRSPAPTSHIAIAALLDFGFILAFVSIGRRTHDEGIAAGGVASTVWPFVVGMGIGWLAGRVWRQPLAIISGFAVWSATVISGMLLRRFVADDGTAISFIIVTAAFTAVTLVGWRVAAMLMSSGSDVAGD